MKVAHKLTHQSEQPTVGRTTAEITTLDKEGSAAYSCIANFIRASASGHGSSCAGTRPSELSQLSQQQQKQQQRRPPHTAKLSASSSKSPFIAPCGAAAAFPPFPLRHRQRLCSPRTTRRAVRGHPLPSLCRHLSHSLEPPLAPVLWPLRLIPAAHRFGASRASKLTCSFL